MVLCMTENRWLRVTDVRPDGMKYEVTGQASTDLEAVRLANGVLEHVERIGITDYLREDGLTGAPPASLIVEPVEHEERGSGFGLVIIHPNGHVVRK